MIKIGRKHNGFSLESKRKSEYDRMRMKELSKGEERYRSMTVICGTMNERKLVKIWMN